MRLSSYFSLANLFTLCIGVFLALVAIEGALRIIPNRWQIGNKMGIFDPSIGGLPYPSQTFTSSSDCFYVEQVHVNSLGFRDREREVKKTNLRVALLGDSFVEAVQIRDEEVINRLLEQKFPSVEFLNFGVDDFGTTQEFLIYTNKVRDFMPDIVLLFFCSNDVRNNSFILESSTGHYKGGSSTRAHFYKLADGSLKFKPPTPAPSSRLWKLGKYLLCVRAASEFRYKMIVHRLKKESARLIGSQAGWPYYWPPLSISYGAYQEPEQAAWKEAWEITEELLLKLRDAVESDGAKLVLVVLAEKIPLDHDPLRSIKEETTLSPPPNFDPNYIANRLETFAKANGIRFLSLIPYFREYRDECNLSYPYYFFPCDGHWNALGHKVAAEVVAHYLVQQGLIPKKLASPGEGPKTSCTEP
jgi:hypothetical protein